MSDFQLGNALAKPVLAYAPAGPLQEETNIVDPSQFRLRSVYLQSQLQYSTSAGKVADKSHTSSAEVAK